MIERLKILVGKVLLSIMLIVMLINLNHQLFFSKRLSILFYFPYGQGQMALASESFDYLRLIIMFSLLFIAFSQTLFRISEGKNNYYTLIKYRSKNIFQYHIYVLKDCYKILLKEYILLILEVYLISYIVFGQFYFSSFEETIQFFVVFIFLFQLIQWSAFDNRLLLITAGILFFICIYFNLFFIPISISLLMILIINILYMIKMYFVKGEF